MVTNSWDEELFAGTAEHYVRGRMLYPSSVGDALAAALDLDGTGRLLDVGCGPGTLTLVLAPYFAEVVAIDPDPGMLAEARRLAQRDDSTGAGVGAGAGVGSGAVVDWRRMTAEQLPDALGSFDVVTFAQSFHWLDRERVARTVRAMLRPHGACVHVQAITHRGLAGNEPLPHPRPPYDRIDQLITEYLGPGRRAGRQVVTSSTPGDEASVFRGAGFEGPHTVPAGESEVLERTADQLVAATFSLSSATPRQFGDQRGRFEADLRGVLREASPRDVFSEVRRPIMLDVWRPARTH